MTRWTALLFSTAFLILGQRSNGQTDTLSKSQTKNSGEFIKFSGIGIAIGNAPSTTGWIGLYCPLVSSKYFEMYGGYGWNNVQKLSLGIAGHLDLSRQLCPFVFTDCIFSLKRGFVFNEEKPDERHYQVDAAQLLNFGGGIMWHPQKWTKTSFFIKLGYRKLISNYSITPKYPTKVDDSEINTMYHDLFESRFFWSIGVRAKFDTQENKKTR